MPSGDADASSLHSDHDRDYREDLFEAAWPNRGDILGCFLFYRSPDCQEYVILLQVRSGLSVIFETLTQFSYSFKVYSWGFFSSKQRSK